jgi:DNA-binding beta-propeller fold protein YncE
MRRLARTANPANGDVYVATFVPPSEKNPDPKNKLLRYDRNGELVSAQDFGKTPLLGLAFDRAKGNVYVANVGNFAGVESKIQRVAADLSGLTDVAIIPGIGAPQPRPVANPDGSSDTITFGDKARVPNAMAFDSRGNLYVTDSFQGAVYKITNPEACAPKCEMETFSHDPLLATPGFPAFAADGIAVSPDESALFVGSPNGLLFPASLTIVGDDMFVTNLADAYTDAVGDEPEEDVKRWTVSHLILPAP